jgi:cytochrome P450
MEAGCSVGLKSDADSGCGSLMAAMAVSMAESTTHVPSGQPAPVRPSGARPPGPRGLPFVGLLPQLRSNPLAVFLDAADRFGDVVHVKAGPYQGYLLSKPADIKHVLQDNSRNYHKSPLYDRLKDSLGVGLVTSEDGFWLRQRRLAQPAFHRQRIAGMVDTMAGEIARTVEGWRGVAERGEIIDLVAEMMDLTQRIIVRTMFSTDLGSAAEVVKRTWPIVNERIGETFWATRLENWLPTPANRRFRRALGELDAVVYDIITTRRRSGGDHPDLLAMLLSARDEETGEHMTDRQLRDEAMTILLAGHETTALALSWTYFLLSEQPDVDRRLAQESCRVIEGRPGLADTERLTYTRMVFQEALRLYPPAWGFSRVALADDHIAGYPLPARSLVYIIPFVLHRRPHLWPDPERFDPERFSVDEIAARPRFAYLPFGAGPRQCIGQQFAMVEALLTLAMISRRYRVEIAPGQRIMPAPLITLRPRPGIHARLIPRHLS